MEFISEPCFSSITIDNPSDPLYYLKIFSIFFRPSFPIKKKAPAPNNAVGIATYSRSSTGSPHIPSIKITSI